jgi:hypothetical protein
MQFWSRRVRLVLPALALTGVSLAAGGAPPTESKSASIAKQLSQALDAAKLDGMAAMDPTTPGSFVAAIYVPGAQLLVVSARYAAPPLLLDKINTRDFRGLYMDLHSAAMPGSRIFVSDVGADGLAFRSTGGMSGDSWEENAKVTEFNGAWKKAKMTEADYTKVYTDADDRYAKMLSLLLAQAKQIKPKVGSQPLPAPSGMR